MNIKNLLSNPWLGAVGVLCSVIAIPLSLLIYSLQTEKRDLSVSANPNSTIIVKSGASSKITVSFEGKPISSNITTTQVAIWNAGSKAIKTENVLKPLLIHTADKRRILEATVIKETRDVCNAVLDTSRIEQGELGVSWRILELMDGVLIQLVCEGGPALALMANATVEQQGRFDRLLESGSSDLPLTKNTRNDPDTTKVILVMLSFVMCGAAYGFFAAGRLAKLRSANLPVTRRRSKVLPVVAGIVYTLIIAVLGGSLLVLILGNKAASPFGF